MNRFAHRLMLNSLISTPHQNVSNESGKQTNKHQKSHLTREAGIFRNSESLFLKVQGVTNSTPQARSDRCVPRSYIVTNSSLKSPPTPSPLHMFLILGTTPINFRLKKKCRVKFKVNFQYLVHYKM